MYLGIEPSILPFYRAGVHWESGEMLEEECIILYYTHLEHIHVLPW